MAWVEGQDRRRLEIVTVGMRQERKEKNGTLAVAGNFDVMGLLQRPPLYIEG